MVVIDLFNNFCIIDHMKNIPEYKPFYIGNVKIPNPVILAPLAGITDTVFRCLIREMGAGLVYTEMISSQAMYYQNKKTWKMTEFSTEERPVAVQIFGDVPEMMAEAAKQLQDMGYSIIDINLGCSVPKIVRSGGGADLARNLSKLSQVFEKVVKSVDIPVTAKVRTGWNRQEVTAPEICRLARETGVSAIAVHGRTSVQKYSGRADWEFIRYLKDSTDMTMIGNGDIRTPQQAAEMLEYSGCEGIMIGRESYANPWIFRNTIKYLMGEEVKNPGYDELKSFMIEHLDRTVARYGEISGVEKMRKFIAWYTKGLYNSTNFREQVFMTRFCHEMTDLINRYFIEIKNYENRIITF
jgi:tRNA-dihydrouridine synthase B